MDTKNEQSVGPAHEQEQSQGVAAVAPGSADRLAMAEACLAEIRAMMPREWECMELPWCVIQMARDTRRMNWMADSYGAAGMTQAEAEVEARAYEKAYAEAKRRGMADRLAVRAAVDVALALQLNTPDSATEGRSPEVAL